MLIKRLQLGLIHVAVAMTLVPINSTLNRVMIKELEISATLVAVLASFPYLFSPMQVAIGSYSDRHPIFGLRRTPYILSGLILCTAGLMISPHVAFLMANNLALGVAAGIMAFGMWGMGYNLSSVSYLSLATEISGEKSRGKTIATMWFMMITGIILTAVGLSRMMEPYSPETMIRAFNFVGLASLVCGLIGLIGLEPQFTPAKKQQTGAPETYSIQDMSAAVFNNPVARIFFVYLLLLLAAILGQDVLLEPFGAEAFGLTVNQTTRITSIWGTFVLLAILIAGFMEGRVAKKPIAQSGNVGALVGFIIIMLGGILHNSRLFYLGVTLLGLGTGISTVANLSLMFDLTMPGMVGLYIGAWGFSNALSRLVGTLLAGILRDVVYRISGSALAGYLAVFAIEALMLLAASLMLYRIDVRKFQKGAVQPSFAEKVALAVD